MYAHHPEVTTWTWCHRHCRIFFFTCIRNRERSPKTSKDIAAPHAILHRAINARIPFTNRQLLMSLVGVTKCSADVVNNSQKHINVTPHTTKQPTDRAASTSHHLTLNASCDPHPLPPPAIFRLTSVPGNNSWGTTPPLGAEQTHKNWGGARVDGRRMGAEQLILAATAAASARCWWHLAIIRSLQSLNAASSVSQSVCMCV